MSHDSKTEPLTGHLQQLLFSPKGGIEGLLVKVHSKLVQISMDPASADPRELAAAVGKPIDVNASVDHSHKTKERAHPVYKLGRITKLAGKALKATRKMLPVSGKVARIHYAKHGEPNGVMLESGEFVHTRPPGMKKLKLKAGSKVVAFGEVRLTVLGTPLVEAQEVNRVTLE